LARKTSTEVQNETAHARSAHAARLIAFAELPMAPMRHDQRDSFEGPADSVEVVFVTPCSDADAQRCTRFHVRMADEAPRSAWTIQREDDGTLSLSTPANAQRLSVQIDFDDGDLGRRLQTASKQQPIARAVSLHRRDTPPSVFDATAGLGRDAMLLAHLGCNVTACERIAPLALLLDEAAERAPFADRISVRHADAAIVLDDLGADSVDVVLLDPMFPTQGRAQVKKEMQVCRLLAGQPGSQDVLVHRAFLAARERVVVKRHPHEQPLAGAPSFSIDGERVRFDVYLKPKAAPSAP
jgi:16S rRNA (guanine1516-N2)-methyltransferase